MPALHGFVGTRHRQRPSLIKAAVQDTDPAEFIEPLVPVGFWALAWNDCVNDSGGIEYRHNAVLRKIMALRHGRV